MVRGAIFSDDGLYRYTLFRTIDLPEDVPDKGLVVFIMLNPSKADALTNDRTIDKCMKFAESWKYSQLKVVNLFAWRATYPRDLAKAQADGKNAKGPENDHFIKKVIQEATLVVCVWGNANALRRDYFNSRSIKVRSMLLESSKPLHVLALTDGGQPHHPLYLPDDTMPKLWNPAL